MAGTIYVPAGVADLVRATVSTWPWPTGAAQQTGIALTADASAKEAVYSFANASATGESYVEVYDSSGTLKGYWWVILVTSGSAVCQNDPSTAFVTAVTSPQSGDAFEYLESNVGTGGSAVAASVSSTPIDGDITDLQLKQAILAFLCGKSPLDDNGDGTFTISFKRQDGTTEAFNVTYDSSSGIRTVTGGVP